MSLKELNEFGLRQKDMDFLRLVFEEASTIEELKIFGSRASGKFHSGSDIDLVFFGNQLNPSELALIAFRLRHESPTFLHFDILDFSTITNVSLLENIEKHGQLVYSKLRQLEDSHP